jgi:small subunit ribosomal protein S9
MKTIHISGKRKSAIARATLNEGSGKIRINNLLIEFYEPEISRQKLFEPILLAGDLMKKVDINVVVRGGGQSSQAEAARLAIARCLSVMDKKLEDVFLKYDRHLIVADVRRKETHKPNRHGKARAKTQKSYR